MDEVAKRIRSDEAVLLCESYLEAQLRGDRRQALHLLTRAVEGGVPVDVLRTKVIQEAQRRIGELWERNEIGIADEHMATAISQVALAHLYQLADGAPPNGSRILVACVEGELHDFPARLAADALDLAGFEVRFLGASVPTESLVRMIEADRPDLVALSVTMSFHLPAVRSTVATLRERFGDAMPIVVGGHACKWSPHLGSTLGVKSWGGDVSSIVDAARAALRERS